MGKNEKKTTQEELEKEEMTVDLELDDGSQVTCAVVTILTVAGKDYIALLPLDESGENADGEVWSTATAKTRKIPMRSRNSATLRTMRNTKPLRTHSTNSWMPRSLMRLWTKVKKTKSNFKDVPPLDGDAMSAS